MLPLNGSRLTGFMKCVETWSGSERQLATLCKENHSSNFHTFTDSKSHFIHLCCNDWISWPVLSAFVLSGGRMECSWMENQRWQAGAWGLTRCHSDVWDVKFMWHSGDKTSLFPLELCARHTAGGNPTVSCCWEYVYLLKTKTISIINYSNQQLCLGNLDVLPPD